MAHLFLWAGDFTKRVVANGTKEGEVRPIDEALCGGGLLGRFPFVIQEYEPERIDPKKPIRYRLSAGSRG